ncbi:Transcriptional regulator GlxA family, contains an amidase domain and an AraC-type DNA-binding HTH domain [Amycolatopsis sacchari]|uniref:Transcriptional regulator GlxA family, contains an amidase domain and an AraC-type DNA-binding HTH domain n=2 Tax=Amycolatopsis sacchari TaxID=115433 RepID=A0A1I3RHT4_9PSEU|nr:helix-turn-helix domain-containing protein [Amycolatopsis sacchari]SFJ45269.1 Transcriptional regulator GlxA family, contains an amidase domain and an AraC-type DNA-binding HTH domain [Amycolatopsis sacchari]
MDNMCEDRAMTVFAGDGRHRVAVLVRDGVLPFELSLVHRLFGQARGADGVPLYEIVTCTPVPGDVRTDADFTIAVPAGPDALAEADTVVVPGADTDYEPRDDLLGPELAAALARIRPGTRIASICTGAFVLAAAGLLDGRRAATHWRSSPRVRERFPHVTFDLGVLYTDEGGILTSAGAAAGIDLCVHMIRRDHGAAVANEVARGTVVPPHREGGQAQYLNRPVPEPRTSSTSRAREWALKNLHRPVTLRELAAREATSTRTFTRRFRDELGTSPGRWLVQQRVERACALLESTDLPVDEIAVATGFGTAGSLRLHLKAELGVSPTAYRATFRGR